MARTVLAVDDSKTMRDMVAFTLKDAGFNVLEAENGQNALEVIAGRKVDVIITDLNMPNMDGFNLIKNIRSGNDNNKFVPILILTTEADSAKKELGKAAGATGWIVKPFNPEKLIQVINKVCP